MSQVLHVPRQRPRGRNRLLTPSVARADWTDLMPRGNAALSRSLFSVAAASVDVFMIFLAAIIAGLGYHQIAFQENGPIELFATMGLFIASIFVLGNAVRGEYSIVNYLTFNGHGGRTIMVWNVAVGGAMAAAFISKTTTDFSRVMTIAFYLLGFVLMLVGRMLLTAGLRKSAREGRAPMRRVFLLGDEAETQTFADRYQPWSNGMRIISAAVLRGPEHLHEDLALAAASARMLRPDDVFILMPWSETKMIDACVNAFLRVPAAIHLGPERVLDRFVNAKISKFGAISSFNLTGHPLTPLEIALKRLLDLVLGSAILLVSLPTLILISIAIRIDSPGPAFFFQRRYGFNQEPFRIVKFRSMRTLDDGRTIAQAVEDDPRITRVGRILRRYNLDELPQVFNVLAGQMSLIGPRPHAVPHDQKFGDVIALYARRHNVKPGITGWAQVNGFRGETATEDAMRQRVEHDLWYIDNWSFLLDLRILYLTIFSAKAYRNAR